MPKLDEDTTLLVLSDHGFAPYRRSFNLNTWLLNNGYITRKPDATGDREPFADVDWSRTRAYGIGLERALSEYEGTRTRRDCRSVPGAMRCCGKSAISCSAVRDPKDNSQVITRVDLASDVYQGPYARSGPDALVGYNRGYRAGWTTILGAFPPDVLEDNTNPWSGDHCMDYTKVPGVLLSNRKIADGHAGADRHRADDSGGIRHREDERDEGQSVFQAR